MRRSAFAVLVLLLFCSVTSAQSSAPQTPANQIQPPPTDIPSRFVDPAVGLSIVPAEGWKLESQAPGRYSGAPKVTFTPASSESGVTAMVALSRSLDERSVKESDERFISECARSIEKNIHAQSRRVRKLGEQGVTIAGVEGIRLDLLTEGASGTHLRRWINIFFKPQQVVMSSRGIARPCGYVVAATAAEAEFDRYVPVFNAMIESVQFAGQEKKN